MIVIIDYGVGNLNCVANMIKKVGSVARISSDLNEIEAASKLVLPGVGAFDYGMASLERMGMIPVLHEQVLQRKTPILGICLGMQLFTRGSEEGELPGLGWIDADTMRFTFDEGRDVPKVPHMGWNLVRPASLDGIFCGFLDAPRFYFVHSYHCVCDRAQDVLATTIYGREFTCAVRSGNIWGTQFHPEKSHKFGKQLLQNFVERI